MRSEKEVRERIKELRRGYAHVLDIPPATVGINAPRALLQVNVKSRLDELYWTLGEERPVFACDDFSKTDR